MSFDWLKQQLDEHKPADDYKPDVPAGGDFVRGFTGFWKQQRLYRIYTTADIDLDEFKPDYKIPTRSQTGIWWYWTLAEGRKELATAAGKQVENRPNQVWRWEMDTDTMIGYRGEEPAAEKFGQTVSIDISFVSLRAKANLIEMHLLFLPSMVQEMALLGGIIKERLFNYDGLIADYAEVGEAYCEMMYGPTGDNKEVNFQEGELWKARSAIWLALGEENPTLWTVGQTPLTNTESGTLAIPLGVMDAPGAGFWMRVTRVAAPRMKTQKEIEKDQNPFGMNVVSQMWMSKEAAIADIDPEGDTDHPEIPELWAGTPAKDFKEWVIKFMADNEFDKKPVPAIKTALKKMDDLESTLALTVDELVTWIEYVRK